MDYTDAFAEAAERLLADKMKQAETPKVVLDQEQVKKAKQERFQLSARILAEENIKVLVVNRPDLQVNADFNTSTKILRLNEAYPAKEKNEVTELIYDRAKLFHEIGHALYTDRKSKLRGELAQKSKDPETFLTVSGLLEDGRQERILKSEYKGTGPYLDALTAVSTNAQKMDVLNGIALYVRHGFWRNETEAKFFAPFTEAIDKAVAADHTDVPVQVGYDIVEAISRLGPRPQPPPPQPTQPDPEGETGEGDEGDGEGESEKTGPTGPTKDGKETGKAPAHGAGAGKSPQERIAQIVADAFAQVQGEADAEWNGILDQVLGDPTQEVLPAEAAAKEQMLALFRNVLTESARTRVSETREGILNTLALPRALTSKRVFKIKSEAKGAPHVALLLDASGSMNGKMDKLTSAGRILNAALREAGIKTKVIAFGLSPVAVGLPDNGSELAEFPVLPLGPISSWGGTPTGQALQVANDWFEQEQANRPLAIIVTDGGPNDPDQLKAQRARLNSELNGYSIGIMLQDETDTMTKYLTGQYDTFQYITDVSHLNDILEPMILDYINS